MLAEKTPASFVAFDLLALDDDPCSTSRTRARGRGWRRRCRSPATRCTSPPTTPTPRRPGAGSRSFEGAGLDGLIAKPPTCLRAGQAADVQDQARPYRRLRGGRLPVAQVADRSSARCCSASTTTSGGCTTSGSRASFTDGPAGGAARRAGALPGERAGGAPVAGWAKARAGRRARGQRRMPGGGQPLDRREGPELGAAAARAGGRGRLRRMEGDRFRHTAQFQRWRPDRDARSCTYEQLERPIRFDVDEVLADRTAARGGIVCGEDAWLIRLVIMRLHRGLAAVPSACSPASRAGTRLHVASRTRSPTTSATPRRRTDPGGAAGRRRSGGGCARRSSRLIATCPAATGTSPSNAGDRGAAADDGPRAPRQPAVPGPRGRWPGRPTGSAR